MRILLDPMQAFLFATDTGPRGFRERKLTVAQSNADGNQRPVSIILARNGEILACLVVATTLAVAIFRTINALIP